MKWHCPYCRRPLQAATLDELPFAPFCGERCKMADLDNWLSGRYVISQPLSEGDLGEGATELDDAAATNKKEPPEVE